MSCGNSADGARGAAVHVDGRTNRCGARSPRSRPSLPPTGPPAAGLDGGELSTCWQRMESGAGVFGWPGLVQRAASVAASKWNGLVLLTKCRICPPAHLMAGGRRHRLRTAACRFDAQAEIWRRRYSTRIARPAPGSEGFAWWESAPEALIRPLDVWGRPPGAELLKLYKSRFIHTGTESGPLRGRAVGKGRHHSGRRQPGPLAQGTQLGHTTNGATSPAAKVPKPQSVERSPAAVPRHLTA